MANNTRFFKQKVTVTTENQKIRFPALTQISLLVISGENVLYEFDNAIDSDSLSALPGFPVQWNFSPSYINVKTATGTAEIYITGIKQADYFGDN